MRMVCGLKRDPTGFCIQALATRIQSAERLLPSATSHVTAKCRPWTAGPTRRRTGRRKSIPERTPSALRSRAAHRKCRRHNASNRIQFVPNWNSIVMPVATPIAKLIPNSVPQNFVVRSTSCDRSSHRPLSIITRFHGEPRVKRHEQEVIQRRERELQPREGNDVEVGHFILLCGLEVPPSGAVRQGRRPLPPV